ncbi:nicotinate-nucleotide pyrophosphorylase [carboxylating] [Thermoflavifilum aggregans]|uniref:Probable nicotinate-nucleotide pyrophosphorylase [carboxylating] n=1 Tax=Thermoflavifilum aggregans TaxID=454188 RepID=A0A2M9CRD5_9BACT|nr:carboxylating nicotinate-nucleotide diphosphorylase [Thermoflavifilum aggregans]PJJ74496.1 nicotinate-nucleotide pyrophosphorylase [carboxylating] [Thermoflavifilum aggregans]
MPTYHSNSEQIKHVIREALREDIGEGDHSSLCCIPASQTGTANLISQASGILAGIRIAQIIFEELDPACRVIVFKQDGDHMLPGEKILQVTGPMRSILSAERLVLNCMQRMSGIATLTRKYVDRLAGSHTRLLDTRKTTPNFRLLEKEAVRIGGGVNHRMGLYDYIMLKDNHIDACGGIREAIRRAKAYVKQHQLQLPIEVETRNLQQVEEALDEGGMQRIMFDHFSPEEVRQAVALVNGRCETEASGNINLDNMAAYAATGVDFISVGAITHQAVSLDMHLKYLRTAS